MEILGFVVIGVLGGVLSGLFGIGGGILIVPALAMIMKMPQTRAQGTSLAVLLLPVGLLGVLEYARKGEIDFRAGWLIAAGFVLGALGGSKIAVGLDPVLMRRIFAGFLVLVAAQLAFKG